MLVRLLLVVLTLAGPLPVPVCTCAASPTVCTDPACPSAPARAPERKTCGCGHSHHDEAAGDPDGGAAGDCGPADAAPTAGVAHRHSPAHHPYCPAGQVRAAPPAAVPTAPADEPAAPVAAPVLSEPVPSLSSAATPRHARDRAPARPLFITFLTLRN